MAPEKRLGVGRGSKKPQRYEDSRSTMRRHFVAMLGEFVGTVLFLWFALSGAQFANTTYAPNDANNIIYVSLSFGFSLMINAWVFYRISGGLFNPAVTVFLAWISVVVANYV